MITALCLNPSLDRTIYVERLERGGTNRVLREHTVPGGKGVNVARLYSGGTVLHASGLKVPVATTVGAGDAMLSGYIAGLERGLSQKEAFRLAIATAIARVAGQEERREQHIPLTDIREI